MDFNGLWKFDGSDETLEITCPSESENYIFEYSDDKKGREKVSIFPSTSRHALLTRSKIFGRAEIYILNMDTFTIEEQLFTRVLGELK
jgi:hypothetical protein